MLMLLRIGFDLAELPENAPRYVLLSHELNHDDGRKSFPLVLVNWAPRSSEMSLLTLHASAFIDFQNTVSITRHQLKTALAHPVCTVT